METEIITVTINLSFAERRAIMLIISKMDGPWGPIQIARINAILELLDYEQVDEFFMKNSEMDHSSEFTFRPGQYEFLRTALNKADFRGVNPIDAGSIIKKFHIDVPQNLWSDFETD